MPGLNEKIRAAGGWWLAGLARALLPGLHRPADWRAMLINEGNRIDIWLRPRSQPVLAATIEPGQPDTLDRKIRRKLKRIPKEAVVLRMLPASAVVSTIEVPESARTLIDAILRNQIERQAPWPIDKAMYGWRLMSVDRERGQLKVQLAVTNREDVAELTGQARALGADPGVIDCGTSTKDTSAISFVSSLESRISRARYRVGRGLALALFATIIVAGYGAYLFFQDYQRLVSIDQAIAQVRRANAKTSSINATGDELLKRARLVIDRRKNEQAVVSVLDAVSSALPDDSWLDRLEVRQGAVYLAGRSGNASAIISALEAAPELADVAFDAPLVRAGTGLKTFSAKASIAPRTGLEVNRVR